jgi:hypothetical protein
MGWRHLTAITPLESVSLVCGISRKVLRAKALLAKY